MALGLVSAGSAIGIQSGPGSMWWEMEMLMGLFWVSLADLVGIGPGAWVGGSLGRLKSLPAHHISFSFYPAHNVNIVFYKHISFNFLIKYLFL